MSSRYWVGGTADWDATAGTKWALTSGGAGGEAVPKSSDDVFFDANSGANTITVSGERTFKTLTCTGFTGTLTGNDSSDSFIFYGNITLSSGMTFSVPGNFSLTGGASCNLTSAGKSFIGAVLLYNASNITLQDDFICLDTTNGLSNVSTGTFNANNHNVTITKFYSEANSTVTMGSGTWELTSTGTVWNLSGAGITLTANTATIKITNTSNTAITFTGGGLTAYNNIWFARSASTAINTITGSNTFADFKDTGTSAHTIKFTDGTTTTITSLTISGSAGNLITLTGTSTGGWTISDGAGTNTVDYCNISYSTATGGATFNANNSTDGGNNSGWNFIITDLNVNISDQLNITENIIRSGQSITSTFDSLTISENVTVEKIFEISTFDSLTITENVKIEKIFEISTFDSLTITENIQTEISTLSLSIFDSLIITENLTDATFFNINILDIITIAESIPITQFLELNIYDSLSISEDTIKELSNFINTFESITIFELTTLESFKFSPSTRKPIGVKSSIGNPSGNSKTIGNPIGNIRTMGNPAGNMNSIGRPKGGIS